MVLADSAERVIAGGMSLLWGEGSRGCAGGVQGGPQKPATGSFLSWKCLHGGLIYDKQCIF